MTPILFLDRKTISQVRRTKSNNHKTKVGMLECIKIWKFFPKYMTKRVKGIAIEQEKLFEVVVSYKDRREKNLMSIH